ncbi:MAG TPA: hypothetical protein VKB05_14365 [Pyrinomonadaceae bacterium]|nr:hypothetical protein [Pyrinomonadaceae bacterium]
MKKFTILALLLALCFLSASPLLAQDQPVNPQPSPAAEELEKQKAEREKNAYRLLDQVIDEAQSLRLIENRVRIQINAADLLWDQNQGRARSLFATAAEGIAESGRAPVTNNNRRVGPNGENIGPIPPQNMRVYQMRQELVLTAARHDAALAYQLLAGTKPPASTQPVTADGRGPRPQINPEDNLEQVLLGRIAGLDPKLAAQNAEQMMDKGQFPTTLPQVLNQLYKQDPDAADKLAEKTVKKIQTANILTRTEIGVLVQGLLRAGPRPATSGKNETANVQNTQWPAVLGQSAYVDLLSTVVDAALKATPPTINNQRGGGPPNIRGGGVGPQPMTDAQIEQNNARRLLAGLQQSLPLVDQYLPTKAALLKQKLSEMGLTSSTTSLAQTFSGLQANATADSLLQAAATAPQQIQSRLYQQAAYKALEEGNTDRARQIANDHLSNNVRDTVMQRIDFRELAKMAEGARIDEIRQSVARLQTDNEKLDLLIQIAGDTQKSNPKLAVQVLEDARQIVNRRATSYQHFEQQLKVAHAFASVDPARSFEMMEPGISQLNELLQAASVLSGFEINMFRDGEMALQGGNGLTSTVNRYGQELAILARSDFERSDTLAGRFQFTEPRIMARLAIVQGLLDVRPVSPRAILGNFGENIVITP